MNAHNLRSKSIITLEIFSYIFCNSFSRKPVQDKKIQVNAQVLTQSSLTIGSLVYLTDSSYSGVYAVSADKLVQAKYGRLME